jgi:mRNA interferase RelE/StbE
MRHARSGWSIWRSRGDRRKGERITGDEDPRRFGKGLKADLAELWRYWVGDYRILCQIKDGELLVIVVAEGHGRDVYE